MSVFDLNAGDCLDPPADVSGEIADIKVVPCTRRTRCAVDDCYLHTRAKRVAAHAHSRNRGNLATIRGVRPVYVARSARFL